MKIGECDNSYFGEDDTFNTQISPKALAALIRQYKHCCRLSKVTSQTAAYRLCPHKLAEAKQYQIRRDHLELFLRVLSDSTSDYDVEEIDTYFGGATDDWSLILKERISD
ncbi:hypothetical protein K1J26_16225 [Enterobacter hormaechei]|uniref:hypothetical protein n=1 Tax=Enterobacter hormaechei TaxID=158836 RepID=UPI001C63BE16|nr:hypothetical protein [Enterobacter hormaechei]MBW7707923.1 hypothetical protein [Enterobacter hormaechei]